jgi:hypothetical protein
LKGVAASEKIIDDHIGESLTAVMGHFLKRQKNLHFTASVAVAFVFGVPARQRNFVGEIINT